MNVTNKLDENLIDKEKNQGDNKLTKYDVFKTCLYLGVSSFGGPMAHIGLFEQILINKYNYISKPDFLHLLSLCKVIPGPTSSQLITAIATVQTNSLFAGIISFLCFNVPGFLIMLTIGYIVSSNSIVVDGTYLYIFDVLSIGLSQSAVAIVFQAVKSLSDGIKGNNLHMTIMGVSAVCYFVFNNYFVMLALMLTGGVLGLYLDDIEIKNEKKEKKKAISYIGIPAFISFITIFIFIHILYYLVFKDLNYLMMSTFYRIGSLIIGGGHVVIPMIISEFSSSGYVKESDVLQSFSIVSMLPGPMFNIAAYIGVLVNGIVGGILSWFFIFLSGMLLLFTTLGFMKKIKEGKNIRLFLNGISSTAIGFILATGFILWYDSCFMNPFYNSLTGTINVIISLFLFIKFPSITPFILAMGAAYSYLVKIILKDTLLIPLL